MKLTPTDKRVLNHCLGMWYVELGNSMEDIWGIDKDLCDGSDLRDLSVDTALVITTSCRDYIKQAIDNNNVKSLKPMSENIVLLPNIEALIEKLTTQHRILFPEEYPELV